MLFYNPLLSPGPPLSEDHGLLFTTPPLFVLSSLPTLPGAVWTCQWRWQETPDDPDNSLRIPHEDLRIIGILPAN